MSPRPTAGRWRAVGAPIAGVVLAAIGALLWGPPPWLFERLAQLFPGCLYRVATDQPVIALTLDDGPDSITTPLILDELRRHSARATFFLIASRVAGNEELVRRIVAERHEIGNHFMYDRASIGSSPDAFAGDLERAGAILEPYGPVRWARPGSGWYSRRMVAAMTTSQYRCALGSVYPYDPAIPSTGFARQYILRNARPGAIVILHDHGARGRRTAQVLAEVLPELRRRGYRVVSLSELVGAV